MVLCMLWPCSHAPRHARAPRQHMRPPERSTPRQSADTASATEVAASWQSTMKATKMKNLPAVACRWSAARSTRVSGRLAQTLLRLACLSHRAHLILAVKPHCK